MTAQTGYWNGHQYQCGVCKETFYGKKVFKQHVAEVHSY